MIGEVLLTPTKIYVKEIMDLLSRVDRKLVKGMANITGGGMRNISRMKDDVSYEIDTMLPVPQVFRLIQVLGSIEEREMFQTFNMGLGITIAIDPSIKDEVLEVLAPAGGKVIGKVENLQLMI